MNSWGILIRTNLEGRKNLATREIQIIASKQRTPVNKTKKQKKEGRQIKTITVGKNYATSFVPYIFITGENP